VEDVPLTVPSKSGLLLTCAYLPQTTFPDVVTNPAIQLVQKVPTILEEGGTGGRTELRNIDLNNGTLGQNAELSVQWILRVLFHGEDGELDCDTELGVLQSLSVTSSESKNEGERGRRTVTLAFLYRRPIGLRILH
jgi:hypothetical protein